jgi:CheY-like chemotaxis protein
VGRRNSGLSQELRGLSSPHARLHSKPIKPSYLCETLTSFLSGEPLLVAKPARPSISDPEFAVRLPFAVLVVEDNPVNQKLVLLLLSRMGYRAEAVNNGLEAISALQRRRYDVVFMDMHMPEMDGLDATRRIRKLLPEKEQPWIIALTANAMQADRKACLEAGMQDFVIKPVQTADLRSALLNVRQAHTVQIADAGPVLCEEWTMPDYLDELVTEDPALRTELLEVFASDTRRQISELQDAVSRSDIEKA